MTQETSNRDKALIMLGDGAPVSIVAAALGVTESTISQYMSDDGFKAQVTERKFHNMTRQTSIDSKYMDLEEKLLEKAEKVLPLMTKPTDVIRALKEINGTTRRGTHISDPSLVQSRVVNLVIPVAIAQKFVSNINNQVIEVRDDSGSQQSLVTASSGSLDGLAERILQPINHESPKVLEVERSAETLSERLGESRCSEDRPEGAITVEDLL